MVAWLSELNKSSQRKDTPVTTIRIISEALELPCWPNNSLDRSLLLKYPPLILSLN